MATMVIDNGADNPTDRVFGAVDHEGAPLLIDADQFTRFVLHVGALAFDSQILGLGSGQPFDTTETVWMSLGEVKVQRKLLRMRLGQQGIPAGTYRGKLVCYDGSNPNGLIWERGFTVKVIDT